MPEGPSIVILKEAAQSFIGKKIIGVEGNSKKIDFEKIKGKEITDLKSWGKHFLICLPDCTIRIHFMMFGSYLINETKDSVPRLSLHFAGKKVLNFYACSVIMIEKDLDEIYDWSADVMNSEWNSKAALQKLNDHPKTLVCDALLDQHIFSGVGNIIKNEVLFRIQVHPESLLGKLSAVKKKEMIREAVNYSFQFLEWKKEYTLRQHWLVHTKQICQRDGHRIQKRYLGKTNRRTFFCTVCQKLYA